MTDDKDNSKIVETINHPKSLLEMQPDPNGPGNPEPW
jgi:hypothetical protein